VGEALIVRVRVDGRHVAVVDPERLVEDLRDRRQAIRRAGRVREEAVLGLDRVVIDADDDHRIERVLRRHGQDDLLRAGIGVLLNLLALGEDTGRFDGDVDREILPGQVRRIALREDADLLAIDPKARLGRLDAPWIAAEHRVVFEEVRERPGVGDVIYGDDLEAVTDLKSPEHASPDTPESIDRDANCHESTPYSRSLKRGEILTGDASDVASKLGRIGGLAGALSLSQTPRECAGVPRFLD